MTTEIKHNKFRQAAYSLIATTGEPSLANRIAGYFLIILILINVMAVVFETVEALQIRYAVEFYWIEIVSVGIFTIEYGLRLWTCVDDPKFILFKSHTEKRVRYMGTPMAIVDLLAILPFYFTFITNVDLRFLRILRLIRIFKLTRYSAAMTTLLQVMRDESGKFTAAIFIMTVVMIIAASGIYLVESGHQPDEFGSIPQAMWWAIVTLTTVGYGDVTPITMVGKLFAACIMITGVGLVALPTGILASSFSDHLKRNRDQITHELRRALEDGHIDEQEQMALDQLRDHLGISDEIVDEIHDKIVEQRKNSKQVPLSCPHCGELIGSQSNIKD